MGTFTRVAYITKTRNLEGSVVAQSADKLPFLLSVGLEVHFVPPALHAPRHACVKSVVELKQDTYEVEFEGIESIDDAKKLVGCYCLAADESLPDFEAMEEPALLLGFAVTDASWGVLGEVVEVLASSVQATLVVAGEDREVMIPFVDEFVLSVDDDAGIIQTDIPESLLNINSAIENL